MDFCSAIFVLFILSAVSVEIRLRKFYYHLLFSWWVEKINTDSFVKWKLDDAQSSCVLGIYLTLEKVWFGPYM